MPLERTNNREAPNPLVVASAIAADAPTPPGAPGAQWSTPLIGRERDLVDLESILRDHDSSLVTVTGPDGVGKTRLIVTLIERVGAVFPAGVAFVPLGNVTSHDIAVWSIAEALGVSGRSDQSIEPELNRRIQGERLLIVLDDLDQIPDIPAFLERLLSGTDVAKVVVVNEVPLGIAGERVYPLRPLPVDDASQSDDAVALLLRRASMEAETSPALSAVKEIARRVAGMPLGLELVGAYASDHAAGSRLNDVLPQLASRVPEDASERDAVAGAIAWSYDRLAPPLQLSLRQLSVFAAGFLPDAASTILAGAPGGPLDGQAVLDGLIARSLILRVAYDDGQVRYWMPTTIRMFARSLLDDLGEARDACQRHAEWCLEYAEAVEEAFKGADQTRWRRSVAREVSNIRSALEWLYGSGQASSALWIATALGRFWSAGPYMQEGRYWLERGLAPDATVLDLARARALDTLSWLVLLQGDIPASRAMVTEALALFRRLGDVEGIAVTLDSVGEMDLTEGDYRSAIGHLDEGQRHWREIGNRWSMAMSLITLGTATLNAGQRERSRESLMKARTIMEDVGDRRGVGLALLNLGWLYLHQDDADRAAPVLHDALSQLRKHGGALETAEALEASAAFALECGEDVVAAGLYETARAMRRDAGIQPTFLSRLGHLDDRRRYRHQFDRVREAQPDLPESDIASRDAIDIAERLLVRQQHSTPLPPPTSPSLTPRERDVLRLLAEELPVIEIAERLGISPRVATTIANTLYARLGVNGRTQVADAARQLGLVEPHSG